MGQCLTGVNHKSDTQSTHRWGRQVLSDHTNGKKCNWHLDKDTCVPRKNHFEASYRVEIEAEMQINTAFIFDLQRRLIY